MGAGREGALSIEQWENRRCPYGIALNDLSDSGTRRTRGVASLSHEGDTEGGRYCTSKDGEPEGDNVKVLQYRRRYNSSLH